MNLELNRDYINGFETVINTWISQEETQETIVPDASPDISRIVDTMGLLCVKEKTIQDGVALLSGVMRVWTIYQPEGDDGICRMETHVPFHMRAEIPGLTSQGRSQIVPSLRMVEARVLNPRKVLIRADIRVGIHALNPKENTLCTAINCDDKMGVQQFTEEFDVYVNAAVQEKAFEFSDELRLTSGPSGDAQLLGVQAEVQCTESKIIGNKLIFKGETDLLVRYQIRGELYSTRFPLNFSQIMEISNVGENAECTVDVYLNELECVVSGDDGRTLNVTIALLGQATVHDSSSVRMLQDVYSTVYDVTVQPELYSFERLLEHSVRGQNVREILETEKSVRGVIDCSLTVSDVTQRREADQIILSADLCLNMLYLDEQDELQVFRCNLPVSGRLDLNTQGNCQCKCVCPGEVYAAPAVGGVEVRFAVEFHCLLTEQMRIPGIREVQLGEEKQWQSAQQPSVVLRMAVPGERLWDIAKAYSTTCAQICCANHLEEDTPIAGQMLLVPRVR